MQKLPVPNITLDTQDQGSVFQTKMNSLATACKTAVQAYNNQIDAAETAQQYSEAAQQALVDADVTPILQRLGMNVTPATVFDFDFEHGDFTVYESAELGFQKKLLSEAISTVRSTAGAVNTPYGIKTVGANLPRIEFDPVTGAVKGLLGQELSINIALWSEGFTNGVWSKGNVTIDPNVMLAPNGEMAASKLVENAITGNHTLYQTVTCSSSTNYTRSFYLKAGERSWAYIRQFDGVTNLGAWFDLENGITGTVQDGVTAEIEPAEYGFFRCTVTFKTALSASSERIQVHTATGNNVVSYAGDGVSGLYVWGAQLQSGSILTSYSKTEENQGIRGLDYYSRSIEPQQAGFFVIDFIAPPLVGSNSKRVFSISDGTTLNRITVYRLSGVNAMGVFAWGNGETFSGVNSSVLGSLPAGTIVRLVCSFNKYSLKLAVNGKLISGNFVSQLGLENLTTVSFLSENGNSTTASNTTMTRARLGRRELSASEMTRISIL